ncbi:hypothetical protein GSI_14053 [Ganoderma sinense ZZ0214-1]|uniref:Uncharacterized protein n=1 Tax=Ganoderma sinense ZZ0214-1 TaxID=1077348 RepID=A0A2G8RS16_9APHY|nr:hypothetical protein GSI_14053 [Ganoderma sinense ZZ0214-1]
MRSHLTRSSSSARQVGGTLQKQEQDMEVDGEDAAGEDDDDTDSMMEMLAVLQEFQKRKASKSSARSVAFQKEKDALFATARKKAEDTSCQLPDSDKARVLVSELKAKEFSQEGALNELKILLGSQDECVQNLLGHLNGLIEDLSHRRAAQINEASAMLEAQAAAREKSRKRLCGLANARMTENMENQKIAADATALIKHYKSLLLS